MSDDSTKQRILEAAGRVFARRGYSAATVREICRAAGVNLASINYYFGGKQRLYIDSVRHARKMRAEEHPFPVWTDEMPADYRLGDFVRTMLHRLMAMQSAPWQVQLLMREVLEPSEACRELVEEYFKPIFEVLLSIVDELAGVQLAEHQRRKIGFSIIGQCLHYRYAGKITSMFINGQNDNESFSISQLAEHITRFSLAAIRNTNWRECPAMATRGKPELFGAADCQRMEK